MSAQPPRLDILLLHLLELVLHSEDPGIGSDQLRSERVALRFNGRFRTQRSLREAELLRQVEHALLQVPRFERRHSRRRRLLRELSCSRIDVADGSRYLIRRCAGRRPAASRGATHSSLWPIFFECRRSL